MIYITPLVHNTTRRLLSALLIITSLLFPAAASFAEDDTSAAANKSGLTIVLTNLPENTPKDATIYVAGSFNGWQPNAEGYRLTAQGDDKYTITLADDVRGSIEFKFTLGSWATSEILAEGDDAPNRNFTIPTSGAATYTGTVAAWHVPARTIAELKIELEKILTKTKTPGMSVAIVRKDGVEWAAGLGIADVATNRPATADTLFRIGSVSKNFTALAIMKLVNEGKLSLLDPVRKLVPEVVFENPWEETDPVRVVDLLEHTTGWDDMHLREYAKDAPNIKLGDALNYHHRSRISRWRPGTRMSYCNSGTAVAAFIVEKLSGQIFEDYVQQHFFAPIGMKTATYFQPDAEQATTLYHSDGKTPHPYWNILLRPAGSINASANDMATYLRFFLDRGEVNGASVLPTSSIERIETPTRNWAAQEGLKVGYGLYNYSSINDGFVFYGHDGGVNGGITSFAYLPEQGVGFFYSINAGNGEAFGSIRGAIQSYITQGLSKPTPFVAASLPQNANAHVGWYEPASPRQEAMYFMERILGRAYIDIADEKLSVTTIMQQRTTFIPVGGNLFRAEADPIATLALITPNNEGIFIGGGGVMKRIPTWQMYSELALVVWFMFALVTTLLYSPFWIIASFTKKWRRPQEAWLKAWPLVAALSLLTAHLIPLLAGEEAMSRLGNFTLYSAGIWLSTVLFAIASIASVIVLWKTHQQHVRRFVFVYAIAVAIPLLITTIYLAYWGIIGIRLWA